VSSLLISPATAPNVQSDGKELFQRAIMESGNLIGYDAISSYSKADKLLAIEQCRKMILDTLHIGDSVLGVQILRYDITAQMLAE
jgi:hypothetical protein